MKSGNEHLQIVLAEDFSPPSKKHHLLVAFRFGEKPLHNSHPAIADTHLRPVGHEVLYECWWIASPVTYRSVGDLRIAECDDYAVVIQDVEEDDNSNLESLTNDAYLQVMTAVRATNHKQLAKAWNYIGGINDGDGDQERYRRFSMGRAAAFAELDLADESAPTGTGVGTIRDRGLTIIALASKHPLQLAENPRQLSAFRYPRQYGPSSPKFARGGLVSNDKHTLYLLSGTAAIVGHESLHPYDVKSQLDETLKNLAALNESVSVLQSNSILRVYLRDPDDVGMVGKKLSEGLESGNDQIVFLHGNICRRELVIEIDGVRVK